MSIIDYYKSLDEMNFNNELSSYSKETIQCLFKQIKKGFSDGDLTYEYYEKMLCSLINCSNYIKEILPEIEELYNNFPTHKLDNLRNSLILHPDVSDEFLMCCVDRDIRINHTFSKTNKEDFEPSIRIIINNEISSLEYDFINDNSRIEQLENRKKQIVEYSKTPFCKRDAIRIINKLMRFQKDIDIPYIENIEELDIIYTELDEAIDTPNIDNNEIKTEI